MECIKKKFKLKKRYVDNLLVPDVTVTYNLKLLLTANTFDLGFFDTYEDDESTAVGYEFTSGLTTVTGYSDSRLSEFKKYTLNTDFSTGYFTSTSPNVDGVNDIISVVGDVTYYIGGITYNDTNDGTIFSFESKGLASPNFVNKPIVKFESKNFTVDKPELNNNVFIIRQSQSVFRNIYRLDDVGNIDELTKYGGGKIFNIINNT